MHTWFHAVLLTTILINLDGWFLANSEQPTNRIILLPPQPTHLEARPKPSLRLTAHFPRHISFPTYQRFIHQSNFRASKSSVAFSLVKLLNFEFVVVYLLYTVCYSSCACLKCAGKYSKTNMVLAQEKRTQWLSSYRKLLHKS